MPNKLYIRPLSVEPDSGYLFEWALYDVAGNKAGHHRQADLDDILQTLMQNGIENIELHVFWPAQAAFSTSVDLPGNQSRYLNQALPFAVEEQIAQSIESVHLVAGDKQKDIGYPVCCVDKASFAALFDSLAVTDVFNLKTISLDAEALQLDDRDMTIVIGAEAALIRSQRNLSIGLQRHNLIPYLDSVFLGTVEGKANEEERYAIKVYVEQSEEASSKLLIAELEQYPGVDLDVETIEISTFELLCESALRRVKPATNFCQGEFRLVSQSAGHWQKWRGVAAVLALGFVIQLAVFIGKGYHYQAQAGAVAEQAVAEYKRSVPGARVTSDKLARVIKGKLNQSKNSGVSEAGFLDLLGEAGYQFSRSGDKQNFKFSSINYNKQRGELVLEMQASSFEQLDRLKKAIVDSGLSAKISSAVQEQGYFRGRISVSGS